MFFLFNQNSIYKTDIDRSLYKLNRAISKAKKPNFNNELNFKEQMNLLRYECKIDAELPNSLCIKKILFFIDTLPFFLSCDNESKHKDHPARMESLKEKDFFFFLLRDLETKIAELSADYYLSEESNSQQKKLKVKAYKALKKVLIARIKVSHTSLAKKSLSAYELSLLAMHSNTRSILNALSKGKRGELKSQGGKGEKQEILTSEAKKWLYKNSKNNLAKLLTKEDLAYGFEKLCFQNLKIIRSDKKKKYYEKISSIT
jgi:hypothetical protein